MTLPTTANTTSPRSRGFQALLGDLYLRLAAAPDRRLGVESAPLQADRVQTAENPEEFLDTFGLGFARSDFTGGEGLDRAHDRGRPDNAPSRFWDSRNVDIREPLAGQTRKVTLLHETSRVDSLTTSTLRMAYDGTAVYVASGTTFRRSADPNAATPTFADESPHVAETATTVGGVAVLGDTVYAALNANGIHRRVSGSWAHWNDLAASNLWAVKDRIVATSGSSLYEVTASGAAPAALKTLSSGVTWTDVCDGGAAILASATDGYVYAFTPTGTAGALELAAQTEIEGETPYALAEAQGFVFYATGQAAAGGGKIGRLWRAVLSDGNVLSNRQVLRQWGDADTSIDRAPRRIVAGRESVFTVVREDATETHAWRYDLLNAGIVRSYIFAAAGLAYGALLIGDRFFAGVDGSGVWREASTFAASGWIIGPLGDFATASDKTWIGATLDADVASGQEAALYYTTDPDALLDADDDGWRLASRTTGGVLPGETALSDVESRYIAGKVTLTAPTDKATTPALLSFTFRAYPQSVDEIVALPVNVSDQIERHNRRRINVRGRGEAVYQELRRLKGDSLVLEVFRPAIKLRGVIEAVALPVPTISERGSTTLYSLVTFRGQPVVSETTGTGSFASYHLFAESPTFAEVA